MVEVFDSNFILCYILVVMKGRFIMLYNQIKKTNKKNIKSIFAIGCFDVESN